VKDGLAKYSNSTMTLIMLAVFVVMVAIASRYPDEARFMPLVVGIPAILLCLVQLIMDARERRSAVSLPGQGGSPPGQGGMPSQERPMDAAIAQAALPHTQEAALSPAEHLRREFILWGYFLGFMAGILLLGFWIAIPAFLVGFLRFQAKASWIMALVLGLGASIAMFFVFERGLKVQLHRGFVVTFVMDQLDR
jgi:hypothetical protein